MRVTIGVYRQRNKPFAATIESVSGSGENVEIRIVPADGSGSIWLEFEPSDRAMIEQLLSHLANG